MTSLAELVQQYPAMWVGEPKDQAGVLRRFDHTTQQVTAAHTSPAAATTIHAPHAAAPIASQMDSPRVHAAMATLR